MSLRPSDPFKIPTSRPIEQKLHVAIFVCPGYFLPDVIGVQTVFGTLPNTDVYLVWKNKDEFEGMPCFTTRANTTFAECPKNLDLLHVGAIPPDVMEDPEALAFVAEYGGRAKWVSGVCVGALMLGAAGLLKGHRATTNFHMHEQLAYYGATPIKANVVEHGNRITSGPVSGSFDLALRLVGRLVGDDIGRECELQMEYAPEPPYRTGSPELAGPELTAKALAALAPLTEAMREVGVRASRRLEIR
ncbi:DJ-1/PfpI family protein [Polyangium sp. y55x31]|uniref:DJ-1/PfpI family protein n=1 Tax=Polyangium sp. y55x31 TaxID=3042688 RepID=UPI00248213DB|nr:DJ-1/PfpI family protein [Polyangium sp. y55x31]MDI1484532.1 DJ-1/PfpI family protein [Polyangium sp. y55x31]